MFLMSRKELLWGEWLNFLEFCGTAKVKEMPHGKREDYLQVTYPSFYEKWYVFQISGRDFCNGGGP